MATDPLVCHDPMVSCQLNIKSKKARRPQVTQVHVFKHIILRITNSRLTVDGSGIRIRGNGQTLLDTFKTPVIALGGGKDSPQGIAQGIEWNDVRGRDGRHDSR